MVNILTNSQGKAYLSNGNALVSNGDGPAVITSLNVTPTTSTQTITAPTGTDGYSPVNVAAVTSSIDSNISAENIKKNITILGVTGSYEGSGGSGIGITREVSAQGVYQMPTTNFTFSLPSNATDIGQTALNYAFQTCTGLTGVNLSSLINVSGIHGLEYAFEYCYNLTSVDLSSLINVSGEYAFNYAFYICSNLTSVDLSSLTIVSGDYAFYHTFERCIHLTNISFPSLTTISGRYAFYYAFTSCTDLTSISFPALTTTSFGSYTNQFTNMLYQTGSTVTHTIHFPSNLESTISGLSGYPLFNGTSGYVVLAFDLPATS